MILSRVVRGTIVAMGIGLAVTIASQAAAKPKPAEDATPAPKAATTIPNVPELQKPGQQPQPQPGQPAGGAGVAASPIAAGSMATPLLTPLQQSEAPGMQPDGSAFAAQFQEGQTMEQPLTLQPGKCYTVVAVSLGIQELDAMIAAQPLPQVPPAPLAQDSSSGSQAVVGGKGSCFRNAAPIAVPAKVIVKATRGSGQAVAQVYVK